MTKIGALATLEEKGGVWTIGGEPVTQMIDFGDQTIVWTANATFSGPRFEHGAKPCPYSPGMMAIMGKIGKAALKDLMEPQAMSKEQEAELKRAMEAARKARLS